MQDHLNGFRNRRQIMLSGRRSVYGRWPAVWGVVCGLLLAALPATAQEALQNMQAGDANASSRTQQMQSSQQDYTYRNGDFRLLVLPSLGLDWNDNINLSHNNTMDDYIVKPAVGITASYPFTQQNLLYLNVSIGYDRYLNHPSLSTFDLNSSSGTGLSFDIGIKHVTLNLHDWMNYTQDAAQNGAVASTVNGSVVNTESYGTFQNTAGLSATWDLNQVTLSAGYDHQNVLATSGSFNNINHASEMLFARAGFQVHPKILLGLESTASFTTYDQSGSSTSLNDNNAYTVGPYITLTPDAYFQMTARGGFSTYQFQQTSSAIQTSSQDSWYAGLTVSHQPTDFMSYSLAVGREVQLGIQSDLVQDWYVRPSITWKIIRGFDFDTSFFYEHGTQGVGNVAGNFTESYDQYGGGLSLQHALTSRLSLAVNYRLTLRSSNIANNGYTQNLVGLQLTYHPQ